MKKVIPMKIKTMKNMNPVVSSFGDSSVDVVEVRLSIVALTFVFWLKFEDIFLCGSVLGVLGRILTD